MAKVATTYVCTECGTDHARWAGRCASCGAWNTLEETLGQAKGRGPTTSAASPLTVGSLTDLAPQELRRLSSDSAEFDRVLGGGIVPGSLILLGGEPGIGKSTLLMQISGALAAGGTVLYVSGEESAEQIGLRARRLGVSADSLKVVTATDTDRIVQTILAVQPLLTIIDSVQTLATDRFQSGPGSVTQVRESAARLQVVAKEQASSIILVGHVTKEGALAGPKVLEHVVDVVLYLEGEKWYGHRLLRGAKNRFGPTDEVGVFQMDEDGLRDVSNPSAVFRGEHTEPTPGTVLTATLEGTRSLVVELQALAVETAFGYPKRTASGFDLNKLQLLIAVLSRHAGLKLASSDIYFNVSGGYRITEPAADLAAALTVASTVRNKPLQPDTVVLGEVGLSGEVRPVHGLKNRLEEARRAGVSSAIVPAASTVTVPGLKLYPVRSVAEAVQTALQAAPVPEEARAA